MINAFFWTLDLNAFLSFFVLLSCGTIRKCTFEFFQHFDFHNSKMNFLFGQSTLFGFIFAMLHLYNACVV